MATTIGILNAFLNLDSRGFHKGFNKADKRMDSFSKNARKVRRLVGGLFAGVGVSLGIREIINITDKYKLLEGRLKLVTKTTAELESVQEKLFKSAQRTRVAYESSIDLYTRLARSSEHLGTSQDDLLQITETLNKAIIVSGATSTEASNALIQLGQGMASGALRGDELRSVLEQLPRVAKAIAEGMGITIGQLREFGTQGKLTAESVIKAIKSQGAVIDKEFKRMPRTVGQAMTEVKNEMDKLIISMDSSAGGSKDLADAISDVAKELSDPATLSALRDFTELLARIGSVTLDTGRSLVNMGRQVTTFFKSITGNLTRLEEVEVKIKDIDTALKASAFTRPGKFLLMSDEDLKKEKARLEKLRELILKMQSGDATKKSGIKPLVIEITGGKKISAIAMEMERLNGKINETTRLSKLANKVIEDSKTPFDKLHEQYSDLNEIWIAGVISSEQYFKAIEKAQNEFDVLIDKTSEFKDVSDDLGMTFSSAFEDAIIEGGKLRDILKGLEQDILRIITRKLITEPLAGGISDFISGAAPSLFGGGKATGGPVSGGTSYLVGEKGPELFTPSSNGSITPNDKLGGIMVNNYFSIEAPRGTVSRESQQQIAAQTGAAVNRAIWRNN
ncbi:MAG: tape measure protein [Gammaproteobacteria bacterium]|nr:tape measure protein [Gammaproteobacteria bacterium]